MTTAVSGAIQVTKYIQHNTIGLQYNATQYNSIQYIAIQYNTMQYNTIQYKIRSKKTHRNQ